MQYQDVMIATRPLVYLPLGDQRESTQGGYRQLGTLATAEGTDATGSPPSQRGSLGWQMGPSTHWPSPGQNADKIGVDHDDSMNVDTFSVAAWVRRSSTGVTSLIASRDGSTGVDRFWQFYFNTSDQLFLLNQPASSSVVSTGTVTDTQRSHHVGFVAAGTAVTFYIDGTTAGTGTWTAMGTTGSCKFVAGNMATNNANHMFGEMGHVAYWTRALTLTEMQRLYRIGRNGID